MNNLCAQTGSWKLAGNSLAGTEKLGSKNNFDVNLVSKNLVRMTIKANGSIGFGTTTPAARFNFYGLTRIDDSLGTSLLPLLILNGRSNNATIELRTNDTLKTIFGYDQSSNSFNVNVTDPHVSSFAVNRATGDVLIGNSLLPSSHLNVFGDQSLDGNLTMASSLKRGNIGFTSDQQSIIFPDAGTSPSAMIYMFNNPTPNKRMVIAHSPGFIDWGLQYDDNLDQFNFLGSGSNKMAIRLTNGFVGINNATPSYRLDVTGDSRIAGNLGVQTAPNTRTMQVGNSQGTILGIGSVENIADGGINILTFNENILPASDNSWNCGSSGNRWAALWAVNGVIQTSDIRDKTNIRDLGYGMKEIMQLHPVRFDWKNDADAGDKLGVIAQEIQKALPEVVRDWEYQVDEQTGKKTKIPVARLGVMYADIIPVLIRGMQEQQKQIDDLKQLVSQLTNVQASGSTSTQTVVLSNTSLEQNVPNPVKQTTLIRYNVASKNAQITVTDEKGKLLKTIPVNEDEGSLNLDFNALSAGAYYYSLIADGKIIDSKKMIVVK
jgi:hypothetical protein